MATPPLTPAQRRRRSEIANLIRWSPDDERINTLRRDLAADRLADHITFVLTTVPALTPSQVQRLRRLLTLPAGRAPSHADGGDHVAS